MTNKVKALLGSLRFWLVTITAIVSILNGSPVLETFQVWAAAVTAIGTLDSVAKKAAGN